MRATAQSPCVRIWVKYPRRPRLRAPPSPPPLLLLRVGARVVLIELWVPPAPQPQMLRSARLQPEEIYCPLNNAHPLDCPTVCFKLCASMPLRRTECRNGEGPLKRREERKSAQTCTTLSKRLFAPDERVYILNTLIGRPDYPSVSKIYRGIIEKFIEGESNYDWHDYKRRRACAWAEPPIPLSILNLRFWGSSV